MAMKLNRRNNATNIAAGASTASRRSFDRARTARGLFGAALSIATLTASLAAPPALHAQSVSFASAQTTVPAQGLGKTSSVVVDGAGNIYIADNSNSRIVKLTPQGVQTTLPISVADVTQLAVDNAGDLFILNNSSRKQLMKYSAAGVLTTLVNQGFGLPQGLTIDHAGDILYADASDEAVSWASPSLSMWYGVTSQSVLSDPVNNPNNLAMGPYNPATGTQYVYIANTGDDGVLGVPAYFTSSGVTYDKNALFLVNPANISLNGPLGVVTDSAGDVFIADTGNNRVVEVPFEGTNSSGPVYGNQVTVPVSGLSSPYGLAEDGAGNLYIADQNNSRVVEMQFHSVNFGGVNVCPSGQTAPAPCSDTISVTFNVTASGKVSPVITTQGVPGLELKNSAFGMLSAAGTTCAGEVTTGTTCTVNVTFSPKNPGLRTGSLALENSSGNILATVPLYGYGEAPQVAFSPAPQIFPNHVSHIPNPTSAVVDAAGNLFFAENSGTVVKVGNNGVGSVIATGLGGNLSLALDGADTLYYERQCKTRPQSAT
jgi:hypothetical protein